MEVVKVEERGWETLRAKARERASACACEQRGCVGM